jgi:hypothetical protein
MEMDQKMKDILAQTSATLKHSSATFKKIKDKVYVENTEMEPSPNIKLWLVKHERALTLPDFFDCVFSQAGRENRLDYINKTIVFNDDAELFGFIEGVPISIYTFFENIPIYFQKAY